MLPENPPLILIIEDEIPARSLRHKLEPDPVHPRYVLTERRTGYRVAVE